VTGAVQAVTESERNLGNGRDAGNWELKFSEKINFLAQDKFLLLTGTF
jgi:hypothetical protein